MLFGQVVIFLFKFSITHWPVDNEVNNTGNLIGVWLGLVSCNLFIRFGKGTSCTLLLLLKCSAVRAIAFLVVNNIMML